MKLAGLVIDLHGNPIPGAEVTLHRGDLAVQATATTSEAGEFAFEVEPDTEERSKLVASAEGFASDEIFLHDGTPGGEALTVTLSPGLSITGQVTDECGTPLQGVRVASSEHQSAITDAQGHYSLTGFKGIETGATGNFEIRGLRPGSYVVKRGLLTDSAPALTKVFEVRSGERVHLGRVTIDI